MAIAVTAGVASISINSLSLLSLFPGCAGDESTLHDVFDRFLVASQSVRDLLLCAKYLFIAARVSVDGQPSLLVGSRSGAKRRWIETFDQSASDSFVRRRYSACPIDSCRNVYSVGQPAMSPCGASAAYAAHHFVLGTSQECPAMASTNKFLAQMNKSLLALSKKCTL